EREQPEYVYLFRHTLLQEVAYQSLLYARRRELHRRIGEYLERRHADEVTATQVRYTPERAGYDLFRDQRDARSLERPAQTNITVLFLLAHHYRLSDQTDKGIAYLLLAGHASCAAYANDEAIQYYCWALELLHDRPADPRSWEAREALGDVYCTVGDYAAALTEHAAILNGAHAQQLPPAVAAEALRSRGYALEKQGQYAAALDELTRAETIACANPDHVPPLLIASIYADMAVVLIRQGEYEQAQEICVAGLERVRSDQHSHTDERIAARLHHPLGMIFGMRGDYAQARFHFESALAIQEQIDNFYGSSVLHNNIGYLWQLQSDYERAIEHYALAEQLARKIKAKYVLSGTYLNTAFAYYNLGKYDAAELGCRAALELCQEMGEQEGIAQVYDMLGQIAYIRGDYDGSLAAFEQALVLQRRIENHYQVCGTLANIAGVYSAMGVFDQAKASVHEANSIAERLQTQKLRAEALNVLAETYLLEAAFALNNSQQHAALLLEQSGEYAHQAEALAEE
ncbi:MAG: tetratricopeptide repeat protein, partial [Chloroflexales bacterium]|nr:tetratricopeptide repeat protein [Chloroflexales bacterium]